ncbi:MAG: membrane-spanning protein [Roseburia sp.]|nr:membrane-spanning protein [Roseburia sp.]
MNTKKYRLYLITLALIAVLVGALSYLYFVEQNETYKDGTLVQNECVVEEELA